MTFVGFEQTFKSMMYLVSVLFAFALFIVEIEPN